MEIWITGSPKFQKQIKVNFTPRGLEATEEEGAIPGAARCEVGETVVWVKGLTIDITNAEFISAVNNATETISEFYVRLDAASREAKFKMTQEQFSIEDDAQRAIRAAVIGALVS